MIDILNVVLLNDYIMKLKLDINLTGKQICDYLDENIDNMREFDELGKRKRIIQIVCNGATHEQNEIYELKKLFEKIIKKEQKKYGKDKNTLKQK